MELNMSDQEILEQEVDQTQEESAIEILKELCVLECFDTLRVTDQDEDFLLNFITADYELVARDSELTAEQYERLVEIADRLDEEDDDDGEYLENFDED